MSKPGRKTGINISGEIEGHLKKKSLLWHSVADVLIAWPFQQELTEEQARNALSHLVTSGRAQRSGRGANAKWKYKAKKQSKTKAEIGTAIHEKVEQYIAESDPHEALGSVVGVRVVDEPKMVEEPEGTFQITGSLIGRDNSFKGTVVQITSPGFSNRPHLLTEL
jgi:hypothetical protein